MNSKISEELNEIKLNGTTKSKLIRPNKNGKNDLKITDFKLNGSSMKCYLKNRTAASITKSETWNPKRKQKQKKLVKNKWFIWIYRDRTDI